MNTINISKKKYNELIKVELDKSITNTEGIIYELEYQGKIKIFKSLFNNNGILFANKLYNIEMLDFYKDILPASFCIPDNLVSVSRQLQGFTLDKLNALNLNLILNDKNIPNEEKKGYLIKIGELLNQLNGIRTFTDLKILFLNDLHESNIMIDLKTKELKVIDLDSIRISNNSAFPSRYLGPGHFISDKENKYIYNTNESKSKYIYNTSISNGNGFLVANENSDLLCYNLIILNFLYKANVNRLTEDEFYYYLEYLYKLGIDDNLLDSFNRLKTNSDNINPKDFIANLTDEQIVRASSKVYTKVRK